MANYRLSDGRVVSTEMPFTLNGIQYPQSWLKRSTAEDRQALGITGPLPPPAWYDARFYTDPNTQRPQAELIAEWQDNLNRDTAAVLAPSDWTVIRELEGGRSQRSGVKAWRASIRAASNTKSDAIAATKTAAELKAYVESQAYMSWPTLAASP